MFNCFRWCLAARSIHNHHTKTSMVAEDVDDSVIYLFMRFAQKYSERALNQHWIAYLFFQHIQNSAIFSVSSPSFHLDQPPFRLDVGCRLSSNQFSIIELWHIEASNGRATNKNVFSFLCLWFLFDAVRRTSALVSDGATQSCQLMRTLFFVCINIKCVRYCWCHFLCVFLFFASNPAGTEQADRICFDSPITAAHDRRAAILPEFQADKKSLQISPISVFYFCPSCLCVWRWMKCLGYSFSFLVRSLDGQNIKWNRLEIMRCVVGVGEQQQQQQSVNG